MSYEQYTPERNYEVKQWLPFVVAKNYLFNNFFLNSRMNLKRPPSRRKKLLVGEEVL